MGGRILLIEDEPAIAESVAYALRGAGFEVDAVGDGDKALDASRAGLYDLMILDLLLPGTPGLSVCRTVRSESPDWDDLDYVLRQAERIQPRPIKVALLRAETLATRAALETQQQTSTKPLGQVRCGSATFAST